MFQSSWKTVEYSILLIMQRTYKFRICLGFFFWIFKKQNAFREIYFVNLCIAGIKGSPSRSNFVLILMHHVVFRKKWYKQESIPVGCVPSAAVAICWGWESAQGDVCPGVSAWGGVCPGGCLSRGCIPACTEADTPPPVNRMTDRQV